MSKLLFKVAKELNVGTQTIVDHLNKKGFDIENKPNAKVTDDMFVELSKQFQSSVAEKEKADQIVIGVRPMQQQPQQPKKEVQIPVVKRDKPVLGILQKPQVAEPATPAILATTPQPDKPEPREEAPIIVEAKPAPVPVVVEEKPIVPPPPPPPQPPAEPPKVEVVKKEEKEKDAIELVERPKVELRGPKILGKIDLNKPKPAPQQPAQSSTPKPQESRPQHHNNQSQHGGKQHGQHRDNSNRNHGNQGQQHNKPHFDNKREQNNPSQQPKQDWKKPTVVEPKEAIIAPVEEPKSVVPDLYRADTPQLKGLKILGKIDTDKFEKAPKKKESNNNRRKDPRGKPIGAPGQPKETGGDDADKQKRKRKRKKVTPGPITQESINKIGQGTTPREGGQNRTGGNNQGGGQNRTGGNNQGGGQNRTGGNNQGGGQNRTGGNNNFRNNNNNRNNTSTSANNRPEQPKEVSQKEIEEKIKATMARLSGGGKNKRQKIRRDKRLDRNERREMQELEAGESKMLQLTEFVTVSELASLMNISVTDVITTCMNLGVMVSINQRLDAEIIEFVASEFGYEVQFISAEDQVETEDEDEDNPEDLEPRAPIVTVMGHVDHGKTSLLDNIRKANVASAEAGGITQHIGAYEVKLEDGRKVTFLDTPGHQAFTAMRARGAKVTDVAVIIIAADDSIMPQTREAIAHAQAASVPIIFAINKIDKPGADPERIKNELAQMNFLVEEWGGKYQSQDISAKKGLNIDLLLEKILLEAELLDLKANPNKRASGTVIEASLDKGRGYVSKLLVNEGTMHEGDPVVAGEYSGRVRAMFNERGQRVKAAGPSTPVLVLGLGGAPQAGEKFKVAANESEARQVASKRAQIAREQSNRASKRISLDEIGRRLALGNFKELKLIVKGDVDGSVEALADSLIKQSIDSVQVNVIHKAVGQINESDVLLASSSDAIIIGFQVRPSASARKLAEREGVEIKGYSVIYEAIDEIKAAIEGMLEPTKEEKETAIVEVREVYKISKIGTVAGCYVQEGKIYRNNLIRVVRDGIIVFPNKEGQVGRLESLKRFKDDVKEVRHQMECGIMIEGFSDIQVGDSIEAYEIIEVKQKLK
jgi:translation initiation factor IF-2